MTVLGPVAAEALGVTLPHEHVFIDLMREYRGDGLLHDEELAVLELAAFKAAGGGTIVDCTSDGLGRDPLALQRVAQATGLNLVMGSGHYREPYLDRDRLDRLSVDRLADDIVRDLDVGVGDTGIRAGIIGEVGCDRFITALEERSFRAAARAHIRTGVAITTHAARWPVGMSQLDLLAEEGVDARRVIVGHCDLVPDPAYHLALAQRGAFVQFDTVQGGAEHDIERRIGYVKAISAAGFEDRVLLSQDVCLRSNLAAMGGCGYTYVITGFRERLLDAGLAEELVTRFLVDNPRRAITGVAA
jgi:predicted metal-dependent phosphotriesterase family hydrolase